MLLYFEDSIEGIRTREGMAVSERVRWTLEQAMVEAGLKEAGERPGARGGGEAAGIPTGSPKSKQHLMGAVLIFMNNKRDSNPGGAIVVRQSGGLSNRERVEPTDWGGETTAR